MDFYITGVRFRDSGEIDKLKVRLRNQPIKNELTLEDERIVERLFIVDLLKTKKISFYTATFNKKTNKYSSGDEVVLYGNKFITTAGNATQKDNLESLPVF